MYFPTHNDLLLGARIGTNMDVFGLVTPTRPPYPGTPQPCSIYIIYIIPPTHAVTHWVVSGGWSSGATRPKTTTLITIPAKNVQDREERKLRG